METTPSAQRPELDSDPGRGRRLGLDVGKVRIGVALSDPDGILATPVETLYASDVVDDAAYLAELVADHGVVEVVVGLPVALSGNHTASTEFALRYAAELGKQLNGVPVRLADERLSTVAATQAMRASGVSARKGKGRIDQAAAVHILQGWLDARRRLGL